MQLIHPGENLPIQTRRVLCLVMPRTCWDAATRILQGESEDESYGDTVILASLPSDESWLAEAVEIADGIGIWLPAESDASVVLRASLLATNARLLGRVAIGVAVDAMLRPTLLDALPHTGLTPVSSLTDTVTAARTLLGTSAMLREGAERSIPARLFSLDTFQRWLRGQQSAGNTLERARLEWLLSVGDEHRPFLWALHPSIFVAAEGRTKSNEVVLGRPDVAAVVLYGPIANDPLETEVVLVREFRTPARTRDGFVRELPSGSAVEESLAFREVARREVEEETGLRLDGDRLRPVAVRQLAATFSMHAAHVFAVELTPVELADVRASGGNVLGLDDNERTTPELWTLREIIASSDIDWSTLGIACAALADIF